MELNESRIKSEIRKATSEKVLVTALDNGGSLRLRIRLGTKGKTATWIAWWTIDGKPRKETVGHWPAMELAVAREKAEDAINASRNPAAPPVYRPTLRELIEAHIANQKRRGIGSADDQKRDLERFAEYVGYDAPAGDLTSSQISTFLHETMVKRGSRSMARRVRAHLSGMFKFAIAGDKNPNVGDKIKWGVEFNPAKETAQVETKKKKQKRALSAEEIQQVWEAFQSGYFTSGMGEAMQIVLATGQRIKETLRVTGKEIGLQGRVWVMPAEKTKGGMQGKDVDDHVIPLPRQAVEIFRRLKADHGEGPLFPSRFEDQDNVLERSLSHAVVDWFRETKPGIPRFTPRDLRRTWKSRGIDGAKIHPFLADMIQQHAQGGTSKDHYDRADYLQDMRDAMDRWELWLDAAIKGETTPVFASAFAVERQPVVAPFTP